MRSPACKLSQSVRTANERESLCRCCCLFGSQMSAWGDDYLGERNKKSLLRSVPLCLSLDATSPSSSLDVCFGKNGRWNPGNLCLTTLRSIERERALASRRMSFKPLFSPPPLKSNTDKFSSHPTPPKRRERGEDEARKASSYSSFLPACLPSSACLSPCRSVASSLS